MQARPTPRQFDPERGSVWLTTMCPLPWRYEGPIFSPPSVWLSPHHPDWGMLRTEITEDSCLSWHPPSATMRMPWCSTDEGIAQEPYYRCQGQCKETLAFLSSRVLQHQFLLDCSERRVRRLEEEKKALQRRLTLKEVRVQCMRTVLQRYPLGVGCHVYTVGREHQSIGSIPLPGSMSFAESYFDYKLSIGEETRSGELDEMITQMTMIGSDIKELRAFVTSTPNYRSMSGDHWVDVFQDKFPGLPTQLINQLPLIVEVLKFSSNN